jgi:hypothetical protein
VLLVATERLRFSIRVEALAAIQKQLFDVLI